jgi:hypothetical protein
MRPLAVPSGMQFLLLSDPASYASCTVIDVADGR